MAFMCRSIFSHFPSYSLVVGLDIAEMHELATLLRQVWATLLKVNPGRRPAAVVDAAFYTAKVRQLILPEDSVPLMIASG